MNAEQVAEANAAAQAHVAGLNAGHAQQVQVMQAQLAAANALGLQVQAQLVAAEARIMRQSRDRPKIPSPSKFNGANGNAIDEWIDEIEGYRMYYPDHFPTDKDLIDYSVRFFDTIPLGWWKLSVLELAAAGQLVTTWVRFTELLRTRFQPIGSAQLARQALDKYVQRGSVSMYTEHFRKCMLHVTDMSMADKVYQYCRGLKTAIHLEVRKLQPKTLDDAINAAHHAEGFLGMYSSSGPPSSNGRSDRPSSYQHRSYGGSSSSGSGGSVAMELNNVNVETYGGEYGYQGDHDDHVDHRSHSSSSNTRRREDELSQEVSELRTQVKFQHSLAAMFGNRDNTSKGKGGNNHRVKNVSKDTVIRCMAENRCINCLEKGHHAADCTKPQSTKW
jgi:hypothetical protein